jgi:23S rRNA pseudouridine2605 synthase
LIRVSYGPFQLAELKPGAIEEVKMRTLRDQLGHRIAREAGVDFDAPLREDEAVKAKRPELARRTPEQRGGRKPPSRLRRRQ